MTKNEAFSHSGVILVKDVYHGLMDDKVLSVGRSRAESLANVGQSFLMHPGIPAFKGVLALKEP